MNAYAALAMLFTWRLEDTSKVALQSGLSNTHASLCTRVTKVSLPLLLSKHDHCHSLRTI
jgi:hypothetical protein